jgi:DNA polymerase elongation subunit (family B)
MEPQTINLPAEDNASEDLGIKKFLEGWNPKEGVVAIETSYNKPYAEVVVHDPKTGKKTVEKHSFRPFCYIKDFRLAGVSLYGGNKQKKMEAMSKYGVEIKPLRITDDNNAVNARLNEGYKFLVTTSSDRGYEAISRFFAEGGVDIWAKRKKTAVFRPTNPGTNNAGEMFTKLEERGDATFWYNNMLKRYEVHIRAANVSRYVDNLDDDVSFIRLKADGDNLIQDTDYTVTYNEDHELFIVALAGEKTTPTADELALSLSIGATAERAKTLITETETTYGVENLVSWTVFLSSQTPKLPLDQLILLEEEAELIAQLKLEKNWSKTDQSAYTKLKSTYNKYKKAEQAVALAVEKAEAKLIKVKHIRNYKKLTVEYRESYSDLFFTMKREEQFMVQTGIRLFKGYENYTELHKFIFDIETTGLSAKTSRIFMIGCRDNRGTEELLAVRPGMDADDEERRIIAQLFFLLRKLKPAIIYGYNSENFDFEFVIERARILGMIQQNLGRDGKPSPTVEILGVPTTLIDGIHMKRRPGATVKYGGESEEYTQTLMHGYNVLDILHAVRRTQAINSDMKEAGLKYVCKFAKIAKPNRIYIPGNQIYTMWAEDKDYSTDKENGRYRLATPDDIMNYPTSIQKGSELVRQYLIDDLWETQQVDERYNEDRFLVGKLLPTFFSRTCTMGGAATWNLIMAAWSYENGLAIPSRLKPQTFTGGLSRTFTLGKFKNVFKFDFSGLYPSLQLEHDIFPKHDVTGVLKRLLLYFKTTRDVFKAMANDESLPKPQRAMAKAKQLPLKILNNSNFGANGSTFFNWSDFTCAERITCLGRLYLRNMIRYFMVYGCKPTVCDTDGINMEVPQMVKVDINGQPLPEPVDIETFSYVNEKGKLVWGADALVEKYNREVLNSKYMKLDNDGMWPTAINISRKNYANMEKPEEGETEGKIKYVGNTLKDKTMPEYVKEFVDKGIRMLLLDQGPQFVEYYYKYLTDIYTMQVPLKKIANKAKVKQRIEDYLADRKTHKVLGRDGEMIDQMINPGKSKQAHMELIAQEGIKVNLGDVVYYVSTGERKSHGYSKLDKQGKVMAKLITAEEMEANPEATGEYNVSKYVDVFNKKVSSLLVPFHPDVRSTIIKDDPTKRESYSWAQMELMQFNNPVAKDNIDNFFILEDSEVAFWNRTGFNPKDVLEEFTTTTPYYGNEYVEKLDKLRTKFSKQGIGVLHQYDKYTNGALVLTFEDGAHALDPETGESEGVEKELVKYFQHQDTLPVCNEDYQRVEATKMKFGPQTQITTGRVYTLCIVENGGLVPLKRL